MKAAHAIQLNGVDVRKRKVRDALAEAPGEVMQTLRRRMLGDVHYDVLLVIQDGGGKQTIAGLIKLIEEGIGPDIAEPPGRVG